MKNKLFIILVLISFFGFGCALRKDVDILNNRIGELRLRAVTSENEIAKLKAQADEIRVRADEISRAGDEKEKSLRGQSAGQRAEIEALKENISVLNGRLEEIDHLLKQRIKSEEESDRKIDGRLARIEEESGTYRTYKDRIALLEQYLSIEAKDKAGTPDSAAAKKDEQKNIAKEISEDELYSSALQSYNKGNYTTAREKFQELITKYPESDKKDNCQFWIGETFYQEKWYEKAILEYQKVIEKYPKGNKVRAALLKQGLSFYNIGDKQNAILVLNELIQKHPKSNEAKIAAKKLKGFK
ncbi:MAG: tol-pal system protein YbgF [Desulfobacterales bacterium]